LERPDPSVTEGPAPGAAAIEGSEEVVPADRGLAQHEDAGRGDETTGVETRFTSDLQDMVEAADRFVDEMEDEALIIVSRPGGMMGNAALFQKVASRAKAIGAGVRILAQISREEVDLVRRFQREGVEVRNLPPGDRLNLSLGIYDRKNMGLVQSSHTDGEGLAQEPKPTSVSGIVSTDLKMVEWVADVFEMLWEGGMSVEDRIAQLEQGIDPPRLEVIRDPRAIQKRMLDLIGRARQEILMLFPTTNAFHREGTFGAIEALGVCASRGVRVSILAPADSHVERTIRDLNARDASGPGGVPVGFRRISPARTRNTVTILVVDRKSSIVIEQRDDSQLDFGRAVGVATYSTSNSTVLAAIRFFERLWDEVELRDREKVLLGKEMSSRKTAELLQDILSHDIRNYNQIARLNAELLREPDGGLSPAEREKRFDALLRAIDESTGLIDKAKRLGRILSYESVHLEPRDLRQSLERSLSVVRAANPSRSIAVSFGTRGDRRPMALCDDLLEDALTNVLMNSVRYTERPDVSIRVELAEEELPPPTAVAHAGDPPGGRSWRLSVYDQGRGIPDEMKEGVFSRYLETAKGSGLGLSIVRALIVDRYSGRVRVRDRVEGDYTKGTVVELWIPEPSATDGLPPPTVQRGSIMDGQPSDGTEPLRAGHEEQKPRGWGARRGRPSSSG
jgi:signal transduction histidine kinase